MIQMSGYHEHCRLLPSFHGNTSHTEQIYTVCLHYKLHSWKSKENAKKLTNCTRNQMKPSVLDPHWFNIASRKQKYHYIQTIVMI